MLEDVSDQSWSGRYFSTVVARVQESTTHTLWLEQRTVCMELSEGQWHALRDLFREAWKNPDLQTWLHELRQQYGEHG